MSESPVNKWAAISGGLKVVAPYRKTGRVNSAVTVKAGRPSTTATTRMSDQKKEQEEQSKQVMQKIFDVLARKPAPTRREPKKYFNFDADALKQGQSLEEIFDTKKECTDIRDVIDLDDDDVEEIVTGDITMGGVESPVFRMFVTIIILSNAVLIGLRADDATERRFRPLFNTVDAAVLAIFVAEMLLKFYASFVLYFHDWWNVLDFVIIGCMVLSDLFRAGGVGTSIAVIRIFRILRILRAFRSLRNFPILMGLSVLIETIIRSIPDMANIGMLLGLFLCVWSIFGSSLFSDIHLSFENFSIAMWTNFVCLTEDGWWDKYFNIRENGKAMDKWFGAYLPIYSIYFIVSILTGAFLFKNLVIAAVINNLQNAIKAMKMQEQVEREISNAPRMETDAEMNDKTHMALHTEERLNMIGFTDILKTFNFDTQWPLEVSDLRTLTVEKFTRYCFLMECLDENLAEYAHTKERLDRVVHAVNDLNAPGQKGRELNQLITMMRHSHAGMPPQSPHLSDPAGAVTTTYVPYGTGMDNTNAIAPTTDLKVAIAEEASKRYRDAMNARERDRVKQEQYVLQHQAVREELMQETRHLFEKGRTSISKKKSSTNVLTKKSSTNVLTRKGSTNVEARKSSTNVEAGKGSMHLDPKDA